MNHRTPLLLGALCSIALAACSSTAASTPTTTTTTAAAAGSIQWSPAGTFGTEPKVTVPTGPPPTTLQSHDLIAGTGTQAEAGDQVTVQYVGVSYSTKQVFDASWTDGHGPFQFELGVGQVIRGWDEGVVGMRVGGRRELIIPPSLAYGAASPGPGIAPNDTLIFVVDLISVG